MAPSAAHGSRSDGSGDATPGMKADSIRSRRVQDIRMTNNIRVFLWLALGLALYMNYSQWQMDYGPKPTATQATTGSSDGSKPPSLADTVPQAAQTAAPANAQSPAGTVPSVTPTATPAVEATEAAGTTV